MSGRLFKIEISDFLLFHGNVVIELIESYQWLSIFEDNILGQSNFIDAILFALGELPNDSPDNLENLKYKDTNGYHDPRSETFVALKIKFDDGTIKEFKRSIENKTCEYCIDNKLVTRKIYFDNLKSGLKNEIKNILINKNIINSIIKKTPDETSLFFEEISGSIKYKLKYDKLKKELKTEELEERKIRTVINQLKKKLDTFKTSAVDVEELETLLIGERVGYYKFILDHQEAEAEELKKKENAQFSDIINENIIKLEECIKKLSPFEEVTTKSIDKRRKYVHSNLIKICKTMSAKEIIEYLDIFNVDYDHMKLELKFSELIILLKEIKGVNNIDLINERICCNIDENKIITTDIKKQIEIIVNTIVDYNKSIILISQENIKKMENIIHEKEKLISSPLGIYSVSIEEKCKHGYEIDIDKDDNDYDIVKVCKDHNKNKKSEIKLPKKTLCTTDIEKRKTIEDDFIKKISYLSHEIFNKNNIKDDIDTINMEINYLENKSKKNSKTSIRKKFNFIKNNRNLCFMNFFCQLADDINEIYSIINDGNKNSVEFICQNPEEPYLGGIQIKFKGKLINFLDENNKTLAGLVLLFGLNKISPLPFLLLDNIDNQLDDKHFLCLMNYMMHLKTSQQIITIKNSWNENIYNSADVVIFIGKDIEDDTAEYKILLIKS